MPLLALSPALGRHLVLFIQLCHLWLTRKDRAGGGQYLLGVIDHFLN
jgi:hypothetical protein